MNIKSKVGQDLSQDGKQDINQDRILKNANCLKPLFWYAIVFVCGVVGAFLTVLIFSEVVRTQIYSMARSKGDFVSELALWDEESGEILGFVGAGAYEIETNETADDSNMESAQIPQDVRITDSLGRIRFMGQLDSLRGILSGDILLEQDDLEFFAIVNKKSNQYYFLSENTTTIQTGDYYIVLNVRNIPSEEVEVRVTITIFYCPIYDLK